MPVRLRGVAGLLADILVPVAAYYAARAAGASERTALLLGAALALFRIIWVAVRTREVTWPSVLMLTTYAFGLGLGFLAGDARFILVKDSMSTAAIAVVVLIGAALGRPFTLSLSTSFDPPNATALQHRFETEPALRGHYQRGTLVWGFGLLAESLIRVPLIYLTPIDAAAGLSQALMLTVVTVLGLWTIHHRAAVRHL